MAISLDGFLTGLTGVTESITGSLVDLKKVGIDVIAPRDSGTGTGTTFDLTKQFEELKTSFQTSQTPSLADSGDVQKLIDTLARRDAEAPFSAKNILMGTVVIVVIIGAFAFFTRKKK